MSVILTACNKSRQRALERALKKKAEKKRAKREAAQSAHAHKAEADEMDDIEDENNVKIWTFLLNGEPTSVVLHRDTLEVACNGEIVESMSDFCECGTTINFPLGERNAQITCQFGETPRDPMTFSLTVEGNLVPDMNPMEGSEAFGEHSGQATNPF